ncbi:MAG: hypothetical protein QGF59_31640 [Pirellulaceae bacterium]|nr:hypothetical protein [Pirellulaceae bacterium]
MNYFAHGRRFLANPHFLVGTAVPDWLSVVNRRSRARERLALPFVDHEDSETAALARGIVQHHRDDHWFHQTRAFAELNLRFTVAFREMLDPDPGFRPSFLGHILVELLLDSALIEQMPGQLDAYYDAIETVSPEEIAATVNQMITCQTGMLAMFIPRFSAARFLYDFSEDDNLLFRLNNVMRRVRLAPLPKRIVSFFPQARKLVKQRKDELLAGETAM